MDDTDPDKLEAALEQLVTEQARRLQAKIDAGQTVKIETVVVVGPDEDEEEAKARAIAKHPAPNDGREVHREFFYVLTGVPRDPDFGEPQVQSASEEGFVPSPSEETAGSGAVLSSAATSQPTYVRITISNGDADGDPGAIVEAYYTVEDGALVLRDADDKFITSRAVLKGEDPAVLARILLREAEQPKDFNRPIHYPKLGLG